MTGIIMDIQKFSLQDGPGIRTTVFLKGCNMKCKWCHNPESMELQPVLMYLSNKCKGCMTCVKLCPNGVHYFENGLHKINRSKCNACGICVKSCLYKALSISGQLMTVDEVMQEIIKDEKYYLSSSGGVTFSGGEPTLQYEFLLELMTRCKKKGYNIALETNGLILLERLNELAKLTDIFLLDYKLGDKIYKQWTGAKSDIIMSTLKIVDTLEKRIVLRCPIIPGINDNKEHFDTIKKLRMQFSSIEEIEIMAYHDVGKDKWDQCGKEYELKDIKTVSKKQKKLYQKQLEDA